jgi:hypothetical protein
MALLFPIVAPFNEVAIENNHQKQKIIPYEFFQKEVGSAMATAIL